MLGATKLARDASSETITSLLPPLALLLCPLITKTSDEVISSGRPIL